MPTLQFADSEAAVKNVIDHIAGEATRFIEAIDASVAQATVERQVIAMVGDWGRQLLGLAWSEQCRQVTADDIAERGLSAEDVTLRGELDYRWRVMTTLGAVVVASFGYRDRSLGFGSVTRVPARGLFPRHRRCRSSDLCVQWECRLGSEQVFRDAQGALAEFTHGAVRLQDNTVARHMVAVGRIVDVRWQYRRPDAIRTILTERATRDQQTGRPLIYTSTDAHMLRRYVDEGWDPAWKAVNGLRLWCVDRGSGQIIHLGGQYTFGDCQAVAECFDTLDAIGVLPANGDYGQGAVAQIVFISDGAPWIVDHVCPKFPDAVVILDAYHAMEYLAKHAAVLYVQGTPKAKRAYANMVTAMLGKRPKKTRRSATRKGHKKRRCPTLSAAVCDDPDVGARRLLTVISELKHPVYRAPEQQAFIDKITKNAYRMAYGSYRKRGIQIGSGAMESLHRIASQVRLKRPGAKWCTETAEAIINLRMLTLAERWDEFWTAPDISERLTNAFSEPGEHAVA